MINNSAPNPNETNPADNATTQNNEQALPVRNPFNENDDKVITQKDIDNEQKYKEALTERD